MAPLYCRCRDEYEISQPDLHHRKASQAVGARQSAVRTITEAEIFAQSVGKRTGTIVRENETKFLLVVEQNTKQSNLKSHLFSGW